VDGLVAFVGHAIRSPLRVIYFLVVLGAQIQIAVVSNQLGKSLGRFHDTVGMLVEHFKKIALSGQQLAEQHDRLLVGLCGKNMTLLRLFAV
jgi:hypothetical protein